MKKHLRRVARACAAASLVGVVVASASRARADVDLPLAKPRASVTPTLSRPLALTPRAEGSAPGATSGAPYPRVMTMPPWLVLSFTLAGPALFRWANAGPPSLAPGGTMPWAIPHPLCLGAGCEATQSVVFDTDPRASGANASARFLGGLGALPAAALALFAAPTPKKPDALAFRITPMFALGGAGLALRCVW